METGMLWFDDGKDKLEAKVKRAIEYYEKKYERAPNLCVVHPSMLLDGETAVGEVAVKAASAVMPHHFWIGVHEGEAAEQEPKRRKAA